MEEEQQWVITILNWERYNNRTDVKKSKWLRFEHNFFEDYKFYDFTLEERAVWMYLLCEVSKSNLHREHPLNAQHAHRVAGINSELLHRTLLKLKQLQVVEVRTLRGRYANVRKRALRNVTIRYDTIREEGKEKPEFANEPEIPKPESSDAGASPVPPLVNIWNSFSQDLPKVKACGATRKRLAEARWRERPDADYWRLVIERIVASSFCQGHNDRGWRADFDFLIQPETKNKVDEGKYDDRMIEPVKSDYSFLEG